MVSIVHWRIISAQPCSLPTDSVQLLKGARDRVVELRDGDPNHNAGEHTARLGREIAAGSPTIFNATTIGTERTLKPSVADNLYRIVREAISNAVRHANSSRIEAQIVYEADVLTLPVRINRLPELLRAHRASLNGVRLPTSHGTMKDLA